MGDEETPPSASEIRSALLQSPTRPPLNRDRTGWGSINNQTGWGSINTPAGKLTMVLAGVVGAVAAFFATIGAS